MSGKQDKKIRKIARRGLKEGVRQVVGEFRDDILGKNPINPRPRWIPKRVWRWMVVKVINQDFFTKWYG